MLSKELILKKFGNRPQVAVAQRVKAECRMISTNLNNVAKAAGREFNEDEQAKYSECVALMEHANSIIDPSDRYATFSGAPAGPTMDLSGLVPGARRGSENFEIPGDAKDIFRGAAAFIGNGQGGEQAALLEGSGGALQFVVPGWEVESFVVAYPQVDPFGAAGATQFSTDTAHEINIPLITAGDDVAVFAEGAGPSTEQDANVYVAKLGAFKRAFLTKITEEGYQDVDQLVNTLVAEGIRRVFRTVSNVVTDALVASLSGAAALRAPGFDNLETLLDLEAYIDPTWAAPSNCWMMSRTSNSKFRNTRDLQDRPIFDPTTNTLLGYRLVVNDRLAGRVIFGAFGPGVYIRKCPMLIQRLIELYSEQGKIGIRFQQRTDQAFFSDAVTSVQGPQPLVMFTTDMGS